MPITTCALDGNFSTWGNCLVHGITYGDFVIAGIILALVFMIIAAKLRLPAPVSLIMGIGLFFFLMAWVAEPAFSIIFIIILIIAAVITFIGLIRFAQT